MEYFKKILKFAKPYKKYTFLNIFFNVLYAVFSTISFISFIPMLNVLFKETKPIYTKPELGDLSYKTYLENLLNYFVTQQVESNGQTAVLLILILGIIVIFFIKNLCAYLAIYFITFLRNGILKDLRIAMYSKIISLPIGFFSEKRKGDTISRITNDIQEVQYSFLHILEMLVRDSITIIFTLSAMLYMSAKLTVFVLIFLPLSGLLISRIGKSLKQNASKMQNEQGAFLSIVEETLGGLKIIKAFNAQKLFKSKFIVSSIRFFKYSNVVLNRYNLASPLSEVMGIIVIGVILWQGGTLVLVDKTMNSSSFIVYIGFAYNILIPAKAISNASYSIKRGNASAERILDILNTENTIKEPKNPKKKEYFETAISIKNVSFKYDDTYVLKDFSLEIPKEKTVAIVGPSGSGKSTIANLITRFYDIPEGEGSIKIDGINIKNIKKYDLMHLLGYVTQDSLLFNDSIKNNLLIGNSNATQEDLKNATKIANAFNFIQALPKKFDTNIGDSGNKLSGGQKQRISIARAVLKNPPIMIFDEATSSLDTESEKLVQEALSKLMKNRTSIVIAHRLSTIQNADIIVVLKNGNIVEKGNHKELLAQNGIYKNLVSMQTI